MNGLETKLSWYDWRIIYGLCKGKGYYVGCFDENDIANKLDKKAVEKAKEETGLKYTNQEMVYKNKKSVGIKLYVCDLKAMKI